MVDDGVKGRMAVCQHGKIGIVTRVESGDRKAFGSTYHGANVLTGKKWQSISPRFLSAETQRVIVQLLEVGERAKGHVTDLSSKIRLLLDTYDLYSPTDGAFAFPDGEVWFKDRINEVEYDGPEDPDCTNRGSPFQVECALAGCGFCQAACKAQTSAPTHSSDDGPVEKRVDSAGEAGQKEKEENTGSRCTRPPGPWSCTRMEGHQGPCDTITYGSVKRRWKGRMYD